MTKKMKKMVFLSLLAFSFGMNNLHAMQEEDEGPDGPPGAPISDWIPVLIVLGIGFAYQWQQQKNKTTYQVGNQESFK